LNGESTSDSECIIDRLAAERGFDMDTLAGLTGQCCLISQQHLFMSVIPIVSGAASGESCVDQHD
jgi:hypothetical protein